MSDPKYAAFRALAPCPQFEPAVGSIYLFEATVAVDMSRGRNARIRGRPPGPCGHAVWMRGPVKPPVPSPDIGESTPAASALHRERAGSAFHASVSS